MESLRARYEKSASRHRRRLAAALLVEATIVGFVLWAAWPLLIRLPRLFDALIAYLDKISK